MFIAGFKFMLGAIAACGVLASTLLLSAILIRKMVWFLEKRGVCGKPR